MDKKKRWIVFFLTNFFLIAAIIIFLIKIYPTFEKKNVDALFELMNITGPAVIICGAVFAIFISFKLIYNKKVFITLISGIYFSFTAISIELIEEFYNLSKVMDIIEDSFLPIGIVLLSIAVYFWIKESAASYKIIEESLQEKEYLIRETHHRIKNNLNIISSLINIQMDRLEKDKACSKALENLKHRIKSITSIHEKLYNANDFKKINIKDYLNDIVVNLIGSLTEGNINLKIDIKDCFLDIDTIIPLGLITTELVTNALKYGIDPVRGGELELKFEKNNMHYTYTIKNKGIKFPKNVDINNTNTLGLMLVRNLVLQLSGGLDLKTGECTKFKITFPVKKET